MKPQAVIDALVQGNPQPFLNGRCFDVFAALRRHFPQARALYGNCHVVTLIDGCVYDARGLLYYPLGLEQRIVSQVRRNAEREGSHGAQR